MIEQVLYRHIPAENRYGETIGKQPANCVMVCYGGDGTLLEGIHRLDGAAMPVVGINSGHLGFLAIAPKESIDIIFNDIRNNNLKIEQRTMLALEGLTDGKIHYALNEVAIQRLDATMINIKAHIDNQMTASYFGNGVILSTPTGSTAYSLSAGGPIVTPTCNCLILSPLTPHNLTMRPMVIPDASTVRFEIDTRNRPASVSLDNRTFEIVNNTTLTVRRAENSNTPRHLAEFWMIEPEVAFNDIYDNMELAEEFIKYCVQWALDNCMEDITFLNNMIDKELIERLRSIVNTDFVRLSYTDGIKILEDAVAAGHKFEFPVYWGVDLASEHERYLVETHFKRPVILTDYPKDIKAFYMKQNEDGKTVRAMDVLFPKIGEIIGGSEREADYNKLLTRIEEMNIPMKDMWWYLDTRRYGSCPHSGFGLGFERLLLFVTGMSNIRDVIPFPRTPNNAEF
ncbi:MAG: asparagine--tRNA ligase [Bacteroidaceae bacterium]|nr:asparagine--tRNA ligase [Bacteroidaceae bacterium]